MAADKREKFRELYNRGLELLNENKDAEAQAVFFEAAKAAPEGWLALGVELIKEKKHDLAFQRLTEVLALTKDAKVRAATLNNIGMIYAAKGQNAEALKCFQQGSELWPDFADSFSNVALVHKWNGDYQTAHRWVNIALSKDPWHEHAQFVRAMMLLLDCDYEQGFEEYECRWRSKTNGLQKIASPCPEWTGTNGTRLFVYGEQGHGDTILVLRYAKEIRARGVWQCWVGQKSMAPLIRSIPEIDRVLEVGNVIPDFDCHIPAVSLPRVFKTTVETIPPAPYLARPRFVPYHGEGFHIGIAWRGSQAQGNDLFRSTQLKEWLPILNTGDPFHFHSLQVDAMEEGLLYPQLIQHEKPADWMDTARLVSSMDLVISVDTSIVHLCGALGVPCWVAMHCRPYFVYPPKCGEVTPWYSSVRLFRQKKELEWSPVFEAIAKELKCKLI